jgi:hypothetical protein
MSSSGYLKYKFNFADMICKVGVRARLFFTNQSCAPAYSVNVSVSEHMGWVCNAVLMNVYFGSGKPQGLGISGRGRARWANGGNARVSLRATQGRRGRILSQQGGFQVSGKGNKGSKGIIVYITYLSYVYNGTNAVVNDTSCTLHNNNNRNECC